METTRKLIFASVFCLISTSTVGAQVKSPDLYENVPMQFRQRLGKRLSLRIEYERKRQWGKLYDLLYPVDESADSYRVGKKAYVQRNIGTDDMAEVLMIAFVPRIIARATEFGEGTYFIRGCGTFKSTSKVRKRNEIIMAHLVKKEWYFSAFGETSPGEDLCEQSK